VAPFYLLVAFEFFYMASPFALYFYSVYQPGLGLLTAHPTVSWLSFFFLPHIVVETSSRLLDARNAVGALLAGGGFLAFCAGAAQVYYYKLARKGVVTGGVYNFVRHPQYTALAVSSLGVLVLWPRLLVIPLFLLMLFAYYFLARSEERECERRFGSTYTEYMRATGMFLPMRLPRVSTRFPGPASRTGRVLGAMALFVILTLVALGLGSRVRHWTIANLYLHSEGDAAYISLVRMESGDFEELVRIALADSEVRSRLAQAATDSDARFLNYVLPVDWYVSEIPMHPVPGAGGHHAPSTREPGRLKIVFTRAVLRRGAGAAAEDIVLNTVSRAPVAEVWIDLVTQRVVRVTGPPDAVRYPGVPVPTF
jgi:protein-S-isoprenylcysteine O-methyltransferase Ste14